MFDFPSRTPLSDFTYDQMRKAPRATNFFAPFEGVRFLLLSDGQYLEFVDRPALMKTIGGFEDINGVMEAEWDVATHCVKYSDISRSVAEEYVGANYHDMLDDNGEPGRVEPIFEEALRCYHTGNQPSRFYGRSNGTRGR